MPGFWLGLAHWRKRASRVVFRRFRVRRKRQVDTWSGQAARASTDLTKSAAREYVAPLVETFQTISSASVDELWRKVVNLADVSWHPLISSTNVPNGLIPKPGLIYKAVTRFSPFPIRIFVERVDHRELLSFRILAMPGVEERVTYRVESTVWGTRVTYSVTLKGWLSPLVWSFVRPHAARVAAALATAAEKAANQRLLQQASGQRPRLKSNFQDLCGLLVLAVGVGQMVYSLHSL